MKITTKTTKQELKDILRDNAVAVKEKDNSLYDRITYASKMAKEDDSKVTRKDLADLVKEVIALLGDDLVEPTKAVETPVEPKAENSVKKLSKSKKAKEVKEETPADTTVEEKAEVVDEKKSANKSSKLGGKKTPKKEDGVVESSVKKTAQIFPQTLELGDSTYELATDIVNMDDFFKAVEKDDPLVFAFKWTKADLKQFPYFGEMLGKFKSFEKDLDLATCMYMSDEKKVAYMLSMYSEAFYTILPEHLEEVDGIRYSQGIEFQIYRAV